MSLSTAPPTKNEWHHPPAEFDFRSDTFTSPTPAMLAALPNVSLGDDVYGESTTSNALAARLAEMFNKPAALFVLSGTMGNQLCVRSLLEQPPYSVLCDSRCHIYLDEAGGASVLSQATLTPAIPSNGLYLTLEDIKKNVILSEDIHFAPTRLITLENTINGVIHPLSEIRRICAFARGHGIKVHLDGARLWNACSVPGAPTLAEYAAEVDSLSVCISKSLGAPVGSYILGTKDMIAKANHFKKMLGGGIRQAGILTAMADIAVTDVFLKGRLAEANAYAKEVEKAWKRCGGKTTLPVDTNAVWVDLEARGIPEDLWSQVGTEMGVTLGGNRIMLHYQNSPESIKRLEEVMIEVCHRVDSAGKAASGKSVGRKAYLRGQL
ncbi:l-allo-threonine aldolase [Sphaerosporella brunnea]|uniref:L-allo-threonine aldolase n=1 Tax=Sphaerosporella brunnea TaxID=1250544 RepID=A0A5J5FCE2_9PEZI|nr:l-allo-threonine aldolase [Sphaerosporella brunnea]